MVMMNGDDGWRKTSWKAKLNGNNAKDVVQLY